MAKKKTVWLAWICLAAAFCFLSVYMWCCGDRLTDSDISSELILGRLAARENAIIIPHWYYSTELQVINIHLIYSLFFRFLHDWRLIRILSSMISYLLMLSGYYYMLRQMKLTKYFPLSAVFLVFPFSDGYFEYILLILTYAAFISISFWTIGMMFHYPHASKGGKVILLVISAVLAFGGGLGGLRLIATLYLPLLAVVLGWCVIKRKWSPWLICSVLNCGFSGLGYIINKKFIEPNYYFADWSGLKLTGFSAERLLDMLFGVLRFFGYSYGERSDPFGSVISGLVGMMLVISLLGIIFRKISCPEQMWIIAAYVACTLVMLAGLYSFTDISYSDRYAMSALIFAIPVIFVSLDKMNLKKWVRIGVAAVLAAGILLCGISRYVRYGQMDKTKELRAAVQYLEEQNVGEGYATFWNGNVLLELSDGAVEAWCWDGDISQLTDPDHLLTWLQDMSHETDKPGEGTERVFILLSQDEYEECYFRDALDKLDGYDGIEGYKLYIFDNYYDMRDRVFAAAD